MAKALADRAKAAEINPEDAGSLRPRHESAFDDGDLKSASADLLRAAGQTDESSSNSGASRNRSEAEARPAKQSLQITVGARYSRHLRRRLAQRHHARRGSRFAHRHQRYKQARASHRSFRAGRDAIEDNIFQF